jgi:hypothetical protein
MTTPKGAFGFQSDFDFRLFTPDGKQFSELLAFIINQTGVHPNDTCIEKLHRLIICYRASVYQNEAKPKISKGIIELQTLQNHLKKVLELLDTDSGKSLNSVTYEHILPYFMKEFPDDPNALHRIDVASREALQVIDKAILPLKEKQKVGAPPKQARKMVSIEFARLFDEDLGLQPTKTENGVFARCLEKLLAAMRQDINGITIPVDIPSNLKKLVLEAIDSYPDTPPNSLLEKKILWPGL